MFFFQFLHVGGRWEEFLRQCPLHYTGNRGSGAPNVMGTAMLSILCGHWRYAHINAVRGNGIKRGRRSDTIRKNPVVPATFTTVILSPTCA